MELKNFKVRGINRRRVYNKNQNVKIGLFLFYRGYFSVRYEDKIYRYNIYDKKGKDWISNVLD